MQSYFQRRLGRLLFASLLGLFVATSFCVPIYAQQKPNIILINLDDADFDILSQQTIANRFPNLQRFVNEGLQFTNFHVTTPLCGPSRACLLRGQYAHSTGIVCNDRNSFRSNGFDGGMKSYRDRGYLENDISTWMKGAGYRTMMIGKFLHHETLPMVPSGWDDFYHYMGGEYFGTFRFTNENYPAGVGVRQSIDSYRTDLEKNDVLTVVQEHVDRADGKPFFMYLAPFAPHHNSSLTENEGMIPSRYKPWWHSIRMPLNPSINEVVMTDKSTAIQALPRLSQSMVDSLDVRYRERILAMRAFDDTFKALYEKLDSTNLLNSTYIMLTSDNGYQNGHRRMLGKGDSYNQSSHVPFFVIGPNVPANKQANHLLAHIDIAPTIVDLAGSQAPSLVDGRSFKQLIHDPDSSPERSWRQSVLIENWESNILFNTKIHLGSNSARFYDSSYTEWADGTTEFFDLTQDPYQLFNSYPYLSAADKQYYTDYLRLIKKSPGRPQVTVSDPWEFNTLLPKNHAVFGMAQDDEGVSAVKVAIRRTSDFKFWNGSNWQTDFVQVAADLTNPGQQLTSWRVTQAPLASSSEELIGFWAWSFDADSNYSEVKWQHLRLDSTAPVSKVTYPVQGSTLTGNITARGVTTDEREVVAVRMVVKDLDALKFWNGSAWQNDWTFVWVPTNAAGEWSYPLPAFKGLLNVAARGVDDSGNVESRPAMSYFWIE